MTYRDWVAKQNLRVKRDLHEYPWIDILCEHAFNAGESSRQPLIDRLEQELEKYKQADQNVKEYLDEKIRGFG